MSDPKGVLMTDASTTTADPPDSGWQTGVSRTARGRLRRRRLNLVGRPLSVRLMFYAALILVAGAISGWVWHAIVKVPSYLTSDDGSVQMTERSVGQIFSIDAAFVIIGLLAGLGLGLVAWALFRSLGWPVAVVATLGGAAAGVICWLVGMLQGPRDFAERVAEAIPGARVPIDFQLHTASALIAWSLGAIIPVMLYANLSHENDDPAESMASEDAEPPPLTTLTSDPHEGEIEDFGQVGGGQLDGETPAATGHQDRRESQS